jgi:hypothetical protein
MSPEIIAVESRIVHTNRKYNFAPLCGPAGVLLANSFIDIILHDDYNVVAPVYYF